jgi:catechol 2,3-dioxygenase-like lactoylglutathione lyase family enzyme
VIDHIGIHVSDPSKSQAFYGSALAPLGYTTSADDAALSLADQTTLYLHAAEHATAMHIAFRVPSRAIVDAFHAAAIEAGGRDNGSPGIRDEYSPDYYAAFVLDPDGINVEAVCLGDTV